MEPARKIDLQPDTDAMRRHILVMFGAATSGLVELAWISAGRGSGARLFDLTAVDELVEQAASWNLEGRNIYYGVTLKHPDTAPFGRTSDTDADAATAFWADFDEAGSSDRADRLARKFPPTFRVTTGTVPHVRQHFYWLLDEAVRDMAHARAQVSALAATLGGDPSVVNPGRLMRLAGSISWPTKPGRVAQLVTMTEGGPTYTADMIARAVPFGATVRSETRAARADLTFDAAAPQLPAGTGAKPQPGAAGTGSLGVLEARLEDGREEYMRDTVHACGVELVGTTGAWPTADELFEVAWPQFARKVDLSRPGRITAANAQDEMQAKCAAWVRKAAAGGHGEIERMVEGYQSRQRASARPGPTAGQQQASGQGGGFEAAAGGQGAQDEPPADLARPFTIRPTSEIPRRRWLYGDSYIRSFVSVLAAPGGAGKTTLYVVEALSIATGKPLLGITPAERTGVWIMNLEDPADEMERRIGAAAKHYGLDQADIEGRLFVDAGRDKPLLMAQQTRDGITIHKPMVDAIVAKIRANKIGVLIVDPFVASHSVSENDNQAINAVLALWRLIADLTGCCIVLVHHFRKLNGEEGSIDSVRGGSAIIGAVRTARVMNTMTEAEAAKLGVEGSQRRRFVRIDNAKNNLAPPADHASWIELVSVDLGNGSGISDQGGDKVGVATAWEPPNLWEGATEDQMRAIYNYVAQNGPQRAYWKATGWLGEEVIRVCGLGEDKNDRLAKSIAEARLKKWVENKVLVEKHIHLKSEGRPTPHYLCGTLPARSDA